MTDAISVLMVIIATGPVVSGLGPCIEYSSYRSEENLWRHDGQVRIWQIQVLGGSHLPMYCRLLYDHP